MKKLIFLLPLFFSLGCHAYMKDDAELLITFGTTLSFKQVGPKETESKSEAGWDVQEWVKDPLVDRFIDSDGDGELDMSSEE